jgi:hypothetical protein
LAQVQIQQQHRLQQYQIFGGCNIAPITSWVLDKVVSDHFLETNANKERKQAFEERHKSANQVVRFFLPMMVDLLITLVPSIIVGNVERTAGLIPVPE